MRMSHGTYFSFNFPRHNAELKHRHPGRLLMWLPYSEQINSLQRHTGICWDHFLTGRQWRKREVPYRSLSLVGPCLLFEGFLFHYWDKMHIQRSYSQYSPAMLHLKEMKPAVWNTYLHSWVHCSTIHSAQDTEINLDVSWWMKEYSKHGVYTQ